MKKALLTLVTSMLFVCGSAFAMTEPLVNPVPVTIATVTKATLTTEQVKEAIVAAGKVHGWVVKSDAPGRLELELLVKSKHQLVVSVDYSAASYAIEYVASENLYYGKDINGVTVIHAGFRRWTAILKSEINKNLGRFPLAN